MSTLQAKNLHVQVAANDSPKPVLKSASLTIGSSQAHAIMGPNGSGKSTLTYSVARRPDYEVTGGEVLLGGIDLLEMGVDEHTHAGLLLAMQYPVEIPDVIAANFLRTAKTAIGGRAPKMCQWIGEVNQAVKNLWVDPVLSQRDVNAGFSGGEEKRFEILQMKLLHPRFAVLDETDSGLDVDALRIVSEGVNHLRDKTDAGFLLITHYTRILHYIKPGHVHVFIDGRVAEAGGPDLVDRPGEEGCGRYLAWQSSPYRGR